MRSIKDTSVCVIGGAGFLGSHLVDHLIEDRNCTVTVVDNLITGRREFLHPKAKFIHHDITKGIKELEEILFDQAFVFNYAAEPYIPVSFDRPLHVFDTNATGALNVLETAHNVGCEGVLQISSAEIYGNVSGRIKETDAVEPHSTYGAAKLAIDYLVQSRWKEAGRRGIALRQFNCVGERETHPYVIPEIMSQIAHGDGRVCLGNNSERDFLYAGDQARYAVELLERGEWGEVYNLGSEHTIKIYDLATMIGDLVGKPIKVVEDEARRRPWEIWHLQSDNAKINKVLDYRAKTPLPQALLATWEYFKQHNYDWGF